MTKPKWTEDKILRYKAEGRGKGKGANYIPWVKVTDFSSRGNSRRVFSHKTGRVHHLLSDVEWNLFLLLEFSGNVVDIREQYPLERDDTLPVAAQLGIKHPLYPHTAISEVMTVDFLVTFQRKSALSLEAFSCKRTEDAEDARSMEKLEIERSHFNGCDIPYHLVFHTELPMAKVKNIEWIRSAELKQEEIESYPGYYQHHCERIASELANHTRSCSLSDYCETYETRSGAAPGTGLRAVKMLLQRGDIVTDLGEPDLAAAPVSMFRPVSRQPLHIVGGQ
jgi:hypothetical protein